MAATSNKKIKIHNSNKKLMLISDISIPQAVLYTVDTVTSSLCNGGTFVHLYIYSL